MSPRLPPVKRDWVRAYYYLVPLWALLELFLWPGLRASPVLGGSTAGVLSYYALEGIVAFAFWRGFRHADLLALADNAVQLVSTFRFVFLGPLQAVSRLAGDPGGQRAAEEFLRSLPGALVSACILTYELHRRLYAAAEDRCQT